MKTLARGGLVVLANLALFLVLFGLLELAYRIRVDGLRPTTRALLTSGPVPHSDLERSQWVIDDPELGYRLNPASPRFNSRSMRGPEIAVPKPAGRFRIVYLGDSVAWYEPGFVSITRDALSERGDAEIINAAVPGYTSYQEVLFFERYVADTSPDLVIWTYCLNDNHKFLHRFDGDGRMLFTEEAKTRLALDPPWDTLVSHSYVLQKLHRSIAFRWPSQAAATEFEWQRRPDMSIAWDDSSWSAHEDSVARLQAVAERIGARLAVVIFPFEPQLAHAADAGIEREKLDYVLMPQRKLAALLTPRHVTYLDLFPSFLAEYRNGSRLFRDGIHLTPEGHALAAREILSFVDEHRLVPSRMPEGLR